MRIRPIKVMFFEAMVSFVRARRGLGSFKFGVWEELPILFGKEQIIDA